MGPELTSFLWSLAATMAVVCGVRWRSARRRVAINRALHELRRPLHALALSPSGTARASAVEHGSLDLALLALEDLDQVINGSERSLEVSSVCARALVTAAADRWRPLAAGQGRSLAVEWRAGKAFVLADPTRVAQALDNLLVNAIEYGGPRIRIGATICAAGLRLTVSDGGATPRAPHRRGSRRGHGLEVVRRVAEAHQGRFRLKSGAGGTVAALELPLVVAPLAAGPADQRLHDHLSPSRHRRGPAPPPSRPQTPASPTAA